MGPELSEEEVEVMQRFTGFIANFVSDSNPTSDQSWKPYRRVDRGAEEEKREKQTNGRKMSFPRAPIPAKSKEQRSKEEEEE